MSPQEAGDGLESILEFQVKIKGHNKQEVKIACIITHKAIM